jgi:hypothetical protein
VAELQPHEKSFPETENYSLRKVKKLFLKGMEILIRSHSIVKKNWPKNITCWQSRNIL